MVCRSEQLGQEPEAFRPSDCGVVPGSAARSVRSYPGSETVGLQRAATASSGNGALGGGRGGRGGRPERGMVTDSAASHSQAEPPQQSHVLPRRPASHPHARIEPKLSLRSRPRVRLSTSSDHTTHLALIAVIGTRRVLAYDQLWGCASSTVRSRSGPCGITVCPGSRRSWVRSSCTETKSGSNDT